VTLRLQGRFWHPRGMVLARVAQYLQSRIPVRRRTQHAHAAAYVARALRAACSACAGLCLRRCICALCSLATLARTCAPLQEIAEVIIENEKQLDDSAENF
jgi:hypothetical protein